jgi:hypothetical protein
MSTSVPPLPPVIAAAEACPVAVRMSRSVACPVGPVVSAGGMTTIIAVLPRCQAGVVGETAVSTPWVFWAAEATAGAASLGARTSIGVRTPVVKPFCSRVIRPARAGPGRCWPKCRRPVADLQAERRREQEAEHREGGDGGDPAPLDHQAGPAGPPARGDRLVPQSRPVHPLADTQQQRGQHGEGHQDADQWDGHATQADGAQERHRQDQHRHQADRDGDAAERDGAAGVFHRLADRVLVVPAVGDLLTPARSPTHRHRAELLPGLGNQ